MARANASRYRNTRNLLLFVALCCVLVYLLSVQLNSATLGLSPAWSNRAVQQVRHWDGHRKLHLLVILSRHCGESLRQEAESQCIESVSRVCPGFSSRSCILKQGVSQSEACDQTLVYQRGSNDVKDM